MTFKDCKRFADDAHRWSLTGSRPHISRSRAGLMIELSFFRAYLAWEAFLEESFILYTLGRTAPRRAPPKRLAFPPSQKDAKSWIKAEYGGHVRWDEKTVRGRSLRFFHKGKPFRSALLSNSSALEDARAIRNAIAHESESARTGFEDVARNKMGGVLPQGLTVGRFLDAAVPGSAPPKPFLDFYLEKIEAVARQIIPT